jgi:hypothetical protein
MSYFVGLDWGSAAHSACVVDSNGAVVAQLNAEHDAAGLSRLLKELGRVGPAAELPVAIERPDGLLVDTLETGQ